MPLGCATYRAFLLERGGQRELTEIPWQTLSFSRVLDDMSDGSVGVYLDGALALEGCASILSDVEPWEHELGIWRVMGDSSSEDPDWVGPVMEPSDSSRTGVTLNARDLFQVFERRELTTDRTHTATDLATIFSQYITDSLAEDDPGITVELSTAGVVGDRTIVGADRRRSADAMRELARSGVDFTFIGRRFVVGGTALTLSPLATLYDHSVESFNYVKRGLEAATRVTVKGSLAAGIQPIATVGGVQPSMGLVAQTFNESDIRDTTSATQAAQGRLDMLSSSPRYLTVVLLPDAPLNFSDLIPGAAVRAALSSNLGSIEGDFRLQRVDVRATANDLGDTDQVSLQLIPEGAL